MHSFPGRFARASLVALSLALAACSDEQEQAQELFERASSLHAEGDLPAAVIELKSALQLEPDHREARSLLGRTYLTLRDGNAARKELERAIELGLSSPELQRALVEAMLLQGQHEEALATIRANPTAEAGGAWLVLEAESLLGLGREDEARAAFTAALDSGQDEVRARRGLARLAIVDGDSQAAATELDRALALADSDIDTLLLKGELELSLRQNEAAEETFRAALESTPGSPAAKLGLARALLAAERPDEAAVILDELARLAPRNPRVNYLRAVLARQRGDLDGAVEASREVLAVAPNDAATLLLIGQTLYLRRDFAQAEEHLRQLLSSVPDSIVGQKALGSVLVETGQLDEALRLLHEVERRTPDDPQLLAMLGVAYAARARTAGDPATERATLERSKAYLDRAASIVPEASGIRTQLAVSHLATGDPEKAVEQLEAVVEDDPGFARAEALLFLTHMRERRFDQAIEVAESLVAKMPESPEAHNLLGAGLEASGDRDGAMASYQKALTLSADYVAADLNVARMTLVDGDVEGARARYERILEAHPNSEHALVAMARIASDEGRTQESIALLEKARSGNANVLRPRLILANYYLRQGRSEEALEAAAEAFTLAPGAPVAGLLFARAQLANGRNEAAAETLRSVVERAPALADAHFQLGVAESRLGRTAESRAAFERVLELAPGNLQAEMALGALEIRAGELDAAIARAHRVQASEPTAQAPFLLEGDVLIARGDAAGAVQAYERAASLGESTAATLKLASARRRAGQTEQAERELDEWLERYPEDVAARLSRASVRQLRGDAEAAVVDYERIIARQPRNVVALNNLAWLYHEQGDARAVELAERAFEGAPQTAEIMDTYGWLLFKSGQEERGMATLERAWRAAPSNADISYHFAASLAKLGDRDRALEILEPVLASGSDFHSREEARVLFEALGGAN